MLNSYGLSIDISTYFKMLKLVAVHIVKDAIVMYKIHEKLLILRSLKYDFFFNKKFNTLPRNYLTLRRHCNYGPRSIIK